MRSATARTRHPSHHISRAWPTAIALLSMSSAVSCASGLPRPALTQVDAADYVPVPFAPRVPPVEFIPPQPAKDAVWVDGTWEWGGTRYGWRYGSWVVPPQGARHARWVLVRREEDGQLFFAPSSWKDASGTPIDERTFGRALGAAARARARPGLGAPAPRREIVETPTSEDDSSPAR